MEIINIGHKIIVKSHIVFIDWAFTEDGKVNAHIHLTNGIHVQKFFENEKEFTEFFKPKKAKIFKMLYNCINAMIEKAKRR